jgi:SAM-dependent methyltransferase
VKADYGLDAPAVVRNLALGGVVAAIVAALAQVLPAVLPMTQSDRNIMSVWLALTALALFVTSGWMLYSSKVGKLQMRKRVIDALDLRGNERVLDVGCGRGLLLVAAAKRLSKGQVVGLDLWSARDLSGNRPEMALENARREAVEERVKVNYSLRMFPPVRMVLATKPASSDKGPSPVNHDALLDSLARRSSSRASQPRQGRKAEVAPLRRVVSSVG